MSSSKCCCFQNMLLLGSYHQHRLLDRIVYPIFPHILYTVVISNKGNKNVYFNSLKDDISFINVLREKWCEALNDITDATLFKSFKNAKRFAPSVYQYYNQYKLIHRRTINNQLLKRINIVDSDTCLFYKDCTDTIEHIYLHCNIIKKLWNDTMTWVRNIHNVHFIISDHEKIFGCSTANQVPQQLIISVKDVIYQKRKQDKEMTIADVTGCLLKKIEYYKDKIYTIG